MKRQGNSYSVKNQKSVSAGSAFLVQKKIKKFQKLLTIFNDYVMMNISWVFVRKYINQRKIDKEQKSIKWYKI